MAIERPWRRVTLPVTAPAPLVRAGTLIAVLAAVGAFTFTGDAVVVAVEVAAVGYGAVTLLRVRPNDSEAVAVAPAA